MALYLSILTFILISIISVVGVYVLTGLTGMFSLGQASFMAIGAYVSGLLVIKMGLSFPLACLLAIMAAVLVGFIVGLPTVRLRRDYISLVTLGFGEAITALLNQMTPITGGAQGLTGIPKKTSFLIVLLSAIVCIILVSLFKTSKYGRQCIAVKSDEIAAKSMGINVPKVKMIAFLLSVAVTSFSGCLYAFYTTYVDPTMFGWKRSADWVIMVFFGGVNSLSGSILGTVLLTGLPEVLRFLNDYRYVFYAILVLLIINYKPDGLLGVWELTPTNLKKLGQKRRRTKVHENSNSEA